MPDDLIPQAATALDRKTLLALVEASHAVNRGLELAEVFELLVRSAANVLHAQGASVLMLSDAGDELVFRAAVGPGSRGLINTRIGNDQGIAGQVLKTGRAARIDDTARNRNFLPDIDRKTRTRTCSLLAAPLVFAKKTIGVVEVINPTKKKQFSDRDLELLKLFANLTASAARNAQTLDRLTRENLTLRHSAPPPTVVGNAPSIRAALRLARKVAPTRTSVLLTGQTGTGKEVMARALHNLSPRRESPFVAINCAALTETLLESELFGHEKGAFTGASEQRAGRFELAEGGTLFLDEIGEMGLSSQSRLLRVLQEREFVRVGGTQTLRCDVRVIAATNRDLKAESSLGRFREDLYYRLNVFPIELPPLADRLEDVPALVTHFLDQLGPELGIESIAMTDEALAAMSAYHWPGNIRELRNVTERAALLSDGRIGLHDLPNEVTSETSPVSQTSSWQPPAPNTAPPTPLTPAGTTGSRLANQERELVYRTLTQTGWNQTAAARKLGVTRDVLRYRVKKYNLIRPE
jgi:Nif-specific regulatory protein